MTTAGSTYESLRMGWRVAALSGCVFGVMASFVAQGLRPSMAPLAIVVVLISTLVAGRLARLGPALAHGACAWAMIAAMSTWWRSVVDTWHGIPALVVMLVLIEDMVLLGRLGHRARLHR